MLVVGALDGARVGELEVGSRVGADVGWLLGAVEGTPVVGPTVGVPVGASVVGSAVEGGAVDGVWVGGTDSELPICATIARHSCNTSARAVAIAAIMASVCSARAVAIAVAVAWACSASSALSNPIVPFIASAWATWVARGAVREERGYRGASISAWRTASENERRVPLCAP